MSISLFLALFLSSSAAGHNLAYVLGIPSSSVVSKIPASTKFAVASYKPLTEDDQTENEQNSDEDFETDHLRKTFASVEVRNNIDVYEIEPSTVLDQTKEIRGRVVETPALEGKNLLLCKTFINYNRFYCIQINLSC